MKETRLEINKAENRKIIEKKNNKTKSWFFEKVSTIDKTLPRWTKKKREKIQITKIINYSGNTTTNSIEI